MQETNKAQLKTDLKKRKHIKSQLTRFYTFVVNFNSAGSILELKLRLEKIEPLWGEFIDIQCNIEAMQGDSASDGEGQQVEFENKFFECTTKAKEIIANNDRAPQSETSNAQAGSQRVIKLPTIKLEEFDGKYNHWLQFYDTFNLLIDKDESLPSIQKFHYLKSALKGEAARLLDSIEVTDANYTVAWEMLKERYENKRAMVNTYVKSLFELQNLKQESETGLRNLVDSFSRNVRALKKLNVLNTDTLLVYMLVSRLDSITKRQWEETLIDKQNFSTVEELIKFLNDRCFILESLDADSNKTDKYFKKPLNKSFAHVVTDKVQCPFCKDEHYLYCCPNILKLNVDERWTEIKKMRLCVNCFKGNHLNYSCKARGCKKCRRNHNTILHKDYIPNETITKKEQTALSIGSSDQLDVVERDKPNTSMSMHSSQNNNYTLLATVMIYVEDKGGNFTKCRALLDSGSQSNFITEELFNRLNLSRVKTDIYIAGINNKTTHLNTQTTAKIWSRFNNYNAETRFLVLNKLTDNVPISTINIEELKIPKHIQMADPIFNESAKIDVLLGAGIFWDLLCPTRIKLNLDNLVLQETRLGWIVTGSLYENVKKGISCVAVNVDVQRQLENFWKIEECELKRELTPQESMCEDSFSQTHKRENDGRFCVRLPLNPNSCKLGESLGNAIKRFHSLERKLSRNPKLKKEYGDFMSEYERLKHMSKLTNIKENTGNACYLPHHCVIKESSVTTRLRVVFDGSAKTSSGLSLNDILLVGPSIQDDLLSILLRFRMHNYVVTADIGKMYRQINVAESQRDLQRIVWRSDPSHELNHYQLNTLTYGTAPASFLATRCLQQLGYEVANTMPEASKAILHDFYMDDLITGSNTLEATIKLRGEIATILSTAGLTLRQWVSNDPRVFETKENNGNVPQYFISDGNAKTLGIVWDSKLDILKYSIEVCTHDEILTKRKLLSIIAQVFDPLGLVGLVTINAKVILQKLWRLNLDWDDLIPDNIKLEWIKLKGLIELISTIKVPRQVTIKHWVRAEMHGFCDASESAYGCCVYLRTIDDIGNCEVRLLCAKSRVAPIKIITIPRLELCGAVLLAQLTRKILNAIKVPNLNVTYWCDSTIVLSWIAADPNNWKIFVANRVSEIQRLTDTERWLHINTAENPADLISRGVTGFTSENLSLWWSGPRWLQGRSYPTPNFTELIDVPDRKEQTKLLCKFASVDNSMMTKFSSLRKLTRVLAYMLRFARNVSTHKSNKMLDKLCAQELTEAMQLLIKLTQKEVFEEEVKLLRSGKCLPGQSRLVSLNPFLDSCGILRVGGRLSNANIDYEHKWPAVLPSSHPLVTLIINHEHIKNMHCGTEATLAAVRRQFWPIHGRNSVKKILRTCVICARFKKRVIQPQMGQLPLERVRTFRPFLNTGVDYAGPFLIKDGKLRNRKIIKAYLCVFICLSTKAIHLEVVGDLTTSAFLNTLKRFVSRRGLCKKIFSDNGSNFVGANRELKRIISLASEPEISNYFRDNCIEWKFIPPRTPHFGGLWESAVKMAKLHLKKIVATKALTFEELTTVFAQIEAILNSRPLTPLSNDPNDLSPLTPGHFLIGDSLNAIPHEEEPSTNATSRYKLMRQMVQHFWQRWSKEYLSNLQRRPKWSKNSKEELQVGSMVLITGENLQPLHWRLGRVIELHPGSDTITRVVSVKTFSGVVKCTVNKLCVLPIKV